MTTEPTAPPASEAADRQAPKVAVFDRVWYCDANLVDHPAIVTRVSASSDSLNLSALGVNQGDPGAETACEVPWAPDASPNRWRAFKKKQ